jgi:hypothetical protein
MLSELHAYSPAIRIAMGQYAPGYDVTPDGQRFFSTYPTSEKPAQAITVVLN